MQRYNYWLVHSDLVLEPNFKGATTPMSSDDKLAALMAQTHAATMGWPSILNDEVTAVVLTILKEWGEGKCGDLDDKQLQLLQDFQPGDPWTPGLAAIVQGTDPGRRGKAVAHARDQQACKQIVATAKLTKGGEGRAADMESARVECADNGTMGGPALMAILNRNVRKPTKLDVGQFEGKVKASAVNWKGGSPIQALDSAIHIVDRLCSRAKAADFKLNNTFRELLRMVLFKNQKSDLWTDQSENDVPVEMKRFYEAKNDLGKALTDADFKAELREHAMELAPTSASAEEELSDLGTLISFVDKDAAVAAELASVKKELASAKSALNGTAKGKPTTTQAKANIARTPTKPKGADAGAAAEGRICFNCQTVCGETARNCQRAEVCRFCGEETPTHRPGRCEMNPDNLGLPGNGVAPAASTTSAPRK